MKKLFFFFFLLPALFAQAQSEALPYVMLDEPPTCDGKNLLEYAEALFDNFVFPDVLVRKDDVKGDKIYVHFVVDTLGRLADLKIARGIHPVLDSAVMATLRTMPPWKPGRHQGKLQAADCLLPVSFRHMQFALHPPTFRGGGIEKFTQWLHDTLSIAGKAPTAGKIRLQIKISTSGRVEDITILRGINAEWNSEVYCTALHAPKWDIDKSANLPNASLQYAVNLTWGNSSAATPNDASLLKGTYDDVDFSYQGVNGLQAFRFWIADHMIYPPVAIEAKAAAQIVVQFVVDSEGLTDSVKMIKIETNKAGENLKHVFEEEACRVILSSPKWKPKVQCGKAVPVWLTFPMTFQVK